MGRGKLIPLALIILSLAVSRAPTAFEVPAPTAILTTPMHLPEASSLALRKGYPVILTEVGSLSNSTRSALLSFRPVKVVILGLDTAMSILPTQIQARIEQKLERICAPRWPWPWLTPERIKEEMANITRELELEDLKVLSAYGVREVEVKLVRLWPCAYCYPPTYYPPPP